MHTYIKKSKLIFLSIMLILAIMYLSFGSLVEGKAVATNKSFDNIKTIIIDAGHRQLLIVQVR